MRHAGIVAVVVALVLPGSAAAHPAPTRASIVALAMRDAGAYWHNGMPCGGDVRVEAGAAIPTASQAVPSMWATWEDNVEGVENYWYEGPQFSAANFRHCVIHYNAEWWDRTTMLQLWPAFAEGIAHEFEHLENRWQLETPIDNGSLPVAAVSRAAVNYPEWTGRNEPAVAEHHRPLGASTQHRACELADC